MSEKSRPQPKEDKKPVVLEKGFADFVFEIANRGQGFVDETDFNPLGDPSVSLIPQIESHLIEGRIVVFDVHNGGLQRSVIGLRRLENGTEVFTTSRHPQAESEPGQINFPTTRIMKDLVIDAELNQAGGLAFCMKGVGQEDKSVVLGFGVDDLARGKSMTIASAIQTGKQVAYPASHHMGQTRILKEHKYTREDPQGNAIVTKYEYSYEIFNTDKQYPAISLEHRFVTGHAIILAGGVTVGRFSAASPSGWLVKK